MAVQWRCPRSIKEVRIHLKLDHYLIFFSLKFIYPIVILLFSVLESDNWLQADLEEKIRRLEEDKNNVDFSTGLWEQSTRRAKKRKLDPGDLDRSV